MGQRSADPYWRRITKARSRTAAARRRARRETSDLVNKFVDGEVYQQMVIYNLAKINCLADSVAGVVPAPYSRDQFHADVDKVVEERRQAEQGRNIVENRRQVEQGRNIVKVKGVEERRQAEQGRNIVKVKGVEERHQAEQGRNIVKVKGVEKRHHAEQGRNIVKVKGVEKLCQAEQGRNIVKVKGVEKRRQTEQGRNIAKVKKTDSSNKRRKTTAVRLGAERTARLRRSIRTQVSVEQKEKKSRKGRK